MWDDFSDFELIQLAGDYGLQDYAVIGGRLTLTNREELTCMIEEYEYCKAFPDVDFNEELEYN
jgi:hypothetical protein